MASRAPSTRSEARNGRFLHFGFLANQSLGSVRDEVPDVSTPLGRFIAKRGPLVNASGPFFVFRSKSMEGCCQRGVHGPPSTPSKQRLILEPETWQLPTHLVARVQATTLGGYFWFALADAASVQSKSRPELRL